MNNLLEVKDILGYNSYRLGLSVVGLDLYVHHADGFTVRVRNSHGSSVFNPAIKVSIHFALEIPMVVGISLC